MSNWTPEQQNATSFKVINGYIKFYLSDLKTWAGRLPENTIIYVKYDSAIDAMKITSCSNTLAKDKFILSPIDESGTTLVSITSEKVTTEAKTTIDNNTGATTPQNTDSSGNSSGSDTSILSEITQIDDAFMETVSYIQYTNSQEYYDNLESGLRVKDLRGILGMPHQFLPVTDPRIDIDENNIGIGEEDSFGRVYSEKIIKHIPLLLMTPGTPTFMASYSSEQKDKIIGKLAGMTTETFDSIFKDSRSGKYYSLKYAYTEYFHYVNAMLRSAAHFLEIHDEKIDGERLGNLNWLYKTSTMGSEIFSHGNLANFLGPYAGCIAFYTDAGTTVDDSFGNSTTESQLASALNNLSEQGRELNYLIGNVGGMAGVKLDALTGDGNLDQSINDLQSQINGLLGGGNIMSNILGKATTILAGGRLIFPEIWSDSTFSRSYSCSMKLVSPSGDKLSVFLNILVPIYHLLGFTLPRQSANQAYFSPFLVRAYYKGLFNVDMGIIPGLSITKGEEGEWTIDGIPTVANVSFEIKDLYDGLYMSKQSLNNDYNIMSNIQELDYIANSCGINVNDQEVMRTVRMYAALGFSSVTDKVTIGIFGKVSQYFNQKMQNIFGRF